jgi:hypothetical protein
MKRLEMFLDCGFREIGIAATLAKLLAPANRANEHGKNIR